ncbi:unnamed protein product [Psylliodes chrysocephalus]|uniref:Gag-like protein n=1 Tax=Psylliodes chrysocephalus TaxID=3402493 RepID=A0A9P0CP56_9CUCU|nr:unnamed protein product [Psylliodes chrysocephala]
MRRRQRHVIPLKNLERIKHKNALRKQFQLEKEQTIEQNQTSTDKQQQPEHMELPAFSESSDTDDEQENSLPKLTEATIHVQPTKHKRTHSDRSTSMETDGFKLAKKTRPLDFMKNCIKSQTVKTSNKFQPLYGEDIQVIEESNDQSQNRSQQSQISNQQQEQQHKQQQKQKEQASNKEGNLNKGKPPPIVLSGILGDIKNVKKHLDEVIKEGYYIKYTKNNTLIFINSISEFKKFSNELKEIEIEWHTYTLSEDKQHAFVLRGLDCNPEPEEIKEELQEIHQMTIYQVYKMNTKGRPLYLITTDNKTTLNFLNSNIKHILNTKITWERRHNERKLIQCRRCQRWGHATSNCQRNPKCLKCAADHWTKDCLKTPDTPAKCANCLEAHPSSYSKCPEYIKVLEAMESKKPVSLRPAPIPSDNPWKIRNTATSNYTKSVVQEPPRMENDNFPPLPSKQNKPRASSGYTGLTDTTSGIATFTDLSTEFKKLSTLVNLNGLLHAVRDLNNIMAKTPDGPAKFIAFTNFISSIDQYNI